MCPRCSAKTPSWCVDCEKLYDGWVRRHATDIVWQTGVGALLAMIIGLGAPLLGVDVFVGVAGVLLGFGTFIGLRTWSTGRRRRQFLATVPQAYLPRQTTT